MIVYRVENKDKIGPYRYSWFGHLWLCQAHDRTEFHPSVHFDVNGFEMGMLSGFKNTEDLHKWFKGWLELLVFSGFRIVEYDVVGYLDGGQQIAFISIDP